MSTNAGQLLWRRMRITFPANTADLTIDTGITQVRNDDDPPLGSTAPDVASRVQVIPLSPISSWTALGGITLQGEPVIGVNGTVEITLGLAGLTPEPPFQIPELNVLIWDPSTIVGPGDADTYLPVV